MNAYQTGPARTVQITISAAVQEVFELDDRRRLAKFAMRRVPRTSHRFEITLAGIARLQKESAYRAREWPVGSVERSACHRLAKKLEPFATVRRPFGEQTKRLVREYVATSADLQEWLRPTPLHSRIAWLRERGAPDGLLRSVIDAWDRWSGVPVESIGGPL